MDKLHEQMQEALGQTSQFATLDGKLKLSKAIFNHIRSNLFPKNDYKKTPEKRA